MCRPSEKFDAGDELFVSSVRDLFLGIGYVVNAAVIFGIAFHTSHVLQDTSIRSIMTFMETSTSLTILEVVLANTFLVGRDAILFKLSNK